MKSTMWDVIISMSVLFCSGCSTGNSIQNKKPWWPELLTEKGTVDVYLPDFSFAGYYWGEKELPEWPVTLNASDFGANANDDQDDTAALKKAIQAANKETGPVVLQLDPGKYILTDILYIY